MVEDLEVRLGVRLAEREGPPAALARHLRLCRRAAQRQENEAVADVEGGRGGIADDGFFFAQF